MGFLTRLFGKEQPEGPDPHDPFKGDETLRAASTELRGGKFQAARSFFHRLADRWDDRIIAADLLSTELESPDPLAPWLASHPGESEPHLIHGMACIQTAWKARGSGWAKGVSQEQWNVFGGWIAQAEESLGRASALHPSDPSPWCGLMIVDAGARGGEALPSLFDEAVKRAPESYSVHARRQWSLLWKWHGSHEEMFAFARKATERAPKGSLVHGLLAWAHADRWLAFLQEESSGRERSASDLDDTTYFSDGAVRRELVEAWQRSLGSGARPPSYGTTDLACTFAFCFSKAGDGNRTKEALRLTRGYSGGFLENLEKGTFRSLCREHGVSFATAAAPSSR